MAESHNLPAVIAAPGLSPNDGHEHFWSPRNIIAFGIVGAFIVYSFMPYVVGVIQDGRAGDLIISNGKVIETIVVLIIGFFFGTTVNSARREVRAENATAAALAAALPPPAPDHSIKVEPPFTVHAQESPDDPDAARSPTGSAGLPPSPRLHPGDGGPAE